MQAANENYRSPADHRAIVAAQRASQGDKEPERTGTNPQLRRLHKAGLTILAIGLEQFKELNAIPSMAAANDNFETAKMSVETRIKDEVSADDIMEAMKLEEEHPGEYFNPRTMQVFVRDKWRALDSEIRTVRKHSATPAYLHDVRETEEEKIARVMDCRKIRATLGDLTCGILDLASEGASTTEIASTLGCSRVMAERSVDEAIQKYLDVAA